MTQRQATVYLAGPIAGLSQYDATSWRAYAANVLGLRGLRVRQPVIPEATPNFVIPPLTREQRLSGAAVYDFDMKMVREADVILVGFPVGPMPSVGTAVEVGYALALGKPIVLWTGPVGVQEDIHPFIKFAASTIHGQLTEAISAVVKAASPRPEPPAYTHMAGGLKYDDEKLPLGLLPRSALEQTAAVLAHGALKYGAHNWRKRIGVQRNIDAALRHIVAANEGEDRDAASGLPHFAHAICDLMFVIETLRARPDLDDRYHREETLAGLDHTADRYFRRTHGS